ncbi:MAG: TetR/AcrR family transcriptional regulator [Pseudomonadota bacterium]
MADDSRHPAPPTRSERKRADILSAARDAFLEQGYERVVMEATARRAGVSTATLYRHFPSKSDLFEAVAAATMDELDASFPPPADDPIMRLEEIAVAYAEHLSRPDVRAFVRMLVAETGRNASLADIFYDAIKTRLSDIFAEAILAGARAGVLQPTDDPAHAAGQLQGMIEHGTLMRGLVLGDAVPPPVDPATIAREAFATWRARWVA